MFEGEFEFCLGHVTSYSNAILVVMVTRTRTLNANLNRLNLCQIISGHTHLDKIGDMPDSSSPRVFEAGWLYDRFSFHHAR